MGLSMKFDYKVFEEHSLRNDYINGTPVGFHFNIRLSNYRGHFLSCINEFSVKLNGEEIDEKNLRFCINNKEFSVEQLKLASSEFWTVLQPARIEVWYPGGLDVNKEHEITVTLMLRVPYLPLPGGDGDHNYVPLDAGDTCKLKVSEGTSYE